jgi:UTP--glucose-1-phosphate uridylyltransferase
MMDVFHDCSADMVIAFQQVSQRVIHRFGVAIGRSDQAVFELSGVIEKPPIERAPSNLAIAGRYIFRPSVFDAIQNVGPGHNQEIQLTDAINTLIANGARAIGVRLMDDEQRYDIGDWDSYTRALVEFALADPKLRQSVLDAVKVRTDHS